MVSSLSPIIFSSRIAASTSCARSSAAFGSRAGDSLDGALSRPASSAASDSVTSRADFAEIAPRRRLDAIGARAEIDPVEIHFEDLVLGVLLLQPQREQHFLHLALQRPVGLQEQVLRQLLGQRRAALREAAMHQVGRHGAGQADRVDAEMRIEAAVLDRHHRLRDIGRHLVQPDRLAAGHAAIGEQPAVGRDDLDVGRAVGDRPGRGRRHLGAVIDDDAGTGDAAPDRQHEAPVEQPAEPAEKAAAACRPNLSCRASGCRSPSWLSCWARWVGTTRSSSLTDRPRAALPLAGPSNVGSMRRSFRFAMKYAGPIPKMAPGGS